VGVCCSPRFAVGELVVAWKTPNTFRLTWGPPTDAKDDFVKYVVVIGKTDAELRDAEQTARAGPVVSSQTIRASDVNPELGQYELRQSSGFDVVASTIVDQLEPGTEYRTKLLAFDSSGCASQTETVVARTEQDSSFGYVVFDDAPHPGGEPRPFGSAPFATDPAQAFVGDVYVSWPGSGVEGEYELVGIQGLGATLSQDYSSLDFSTAFLEAAVSIEGNPVASWGEARLLLGPASGGCDGISSFQFSPYAFRSGSEYSVIQIPLSSLSDGNVLTMEDLSSRTLCEVSLGQTFASGQGVRIDQVRLRW
jgi:hypothetical protein